MKTLLLDNMDWDLLLDINGNIAVASEPYALAQNVASALRLFQGELWYDTRKGIPYFDQVLGYLPPLSLLRSLFMQATMSVPGVVSARVVLAALDNRQLSGQVQFTDHRGEAGSVII